MTTPLSMSADTPSLATASEQSQSPAPQKAAPLSPTKPNLNHCMKSPLPADQQVKYLHLQAEIDTLLLELQTLKHKRQETDRQPVGAGR
ncbi:hypothetical protein NG798_10220 [Ancylothrix sp. C2]|uniref:hypothetical protein n=1 Tax=Ancylothrix sp. D3o TaxID=2953691 RepID=UPI0021BABB1F|nr:hypothetical protein [Ancylothrix sp. D3o]MCT7950161.1 hypothetical protein [Ancylothrix sp. D3o]